MTKLKKWSSRDIKLAKGKQKVSCLTAGDFAMSRLLDNAGIPLILVGDSLAMTMLGYDSTLPVTLDEMLHHTRAVSRGAEHALVIADMPFLTYQINDDEALRNAGRFLQEAGADGVKIEGGSIREELVQRLVANGIPVMGHIGLTPQSIKAMGGYRVQGRSSKAADQLVADAKALEYAGAFAIVLECVPPDLAEDITEAVSVPTIGIGAGPHCDGQILVLHDLLGLYGDFKPKFAKRYADLGTAVTEAVVSYQSEVSSGAFPAEENCY